MHTDSAYFILYRPAVPGNIGACARAMKTMGFRHLRLIDPADHRSPEALMFAHGSHDILESAALYPGYEEAVADLDFVMATTAKQERSAKEDYLDCRDLAVFIDGKGAQLGKTGIIFGTEESGLPNEIIREANIALTIPMAGQYPSLNLAQAVMVVAYELSACLHDPGQQNLKTRTDRGKADAASGTTLPGDAEGSWKALESRVRFLLEAAGITENTPLFHRILERTGYLREGDIQLLHSVSSRLKKLIEDHYGSTPNC